MFIIQSSVIVFSVFGFCLAKQSYEIYCGACIALVHEMNWKIASVDEKSTVQVGSFRIDSSGNQQLREIPLARSELHLSELLEDVCSRTSDYGASLNADGNRNFIRMSTHDGNRIKLDNVDISASLHSQLKFACESLIDEHEEAVIEAFQENEGSMENYLCVDIMEVCQSGNITDHQRAVDDALSAGAAERAGRDRDAAAAAEQMHTDEQTAVLDGVESVKEDL